MVERPTPPGRDELLGGRRGEVRGNEARSDAWEGSAPARRGAASPSGWRTALSGYVASATFVGATTTICVVLRDVLLLPDVVAVYLATIMLVAVRLERGPAFAASVVSVAAYDFFFIPPVHTFTVNDVRHVLTFAAMLVTGLLISGLTARIRGHEHAARLREARTATLFELSRDLAGAPEEPDVARFAVTRLAESFGGAAAVFVSKNGEVVELGRSGTLTLRSLEEALVKWTIDHGKVAGHGTDTLPEAKVRCMPISTPDGVLGALVLSPPLALALSEHQHGFLAAFVRQLAMALARVRLADEARAATLKARTEEMRSTLLSAVSHDLRTPLAAITGAATAIRDEPALSSATRLDLVQAICEEAERLERLVSNLLDMTRLESGAQEPRMDWVPIEEVVGAALSRLERHLVDRQVAVTIPADLPLVSVDPVLLEQVFVNLLDNAAKYTPPASPLEVVAIRAGDHLSLEVSDRGPGVAPGTESQIFDKFVRQAGGGGGVGLGLAICKAVLEIHGGTIEVSPREGGGATFRMRIPTGGQPPAVAEPPEIVHEDRPARARRGAPEGEEG